MISPGVLLWGPCKRAQFAGGREDICAGRADPATSDPDERSAVKSIAPSDQMGLNFRTLPIVKPLSAWPVRGAAHPVPGFISSGIHESIGENVQHFGVPLCLC